MRNYKFLDTYAQHTFSNVKSLKKVESHMLKPYKGRWHLGGHLRVVSFPKKMF